MRNHMSRSFPLSRRAFVGLGGASLAASVLPAEAAPRAGGNGLYEEPWFLKPSFDLRTDFEAAKAENKTFAIVWEMQSCSWCKLLHADNFQREDILSYAKRDFAFLQLDLRGRRQYVDFDGERLLETMLAMKYGVPSTPTFQFFTAGAKGPKEAGRVAYLPPNDFIQMLRFARGQTSSSRS
jgi:thioredoxin-related protein